MYIIKSDRSDVLIRSLLVINRNQFDLVYARKKDLCDEKTGVSQNRRSEHS